MMSEEGQIGEDKEKVFTALDQNQGKLVKIRTWSTIKE